MAVCRRNLPWLFAVRICRGNLPWVFCICKQNLFCVWEQILFIWKQTFFICEQNVFIVEIFFINSVPFCYCRSSYGPPYNAEYFYEKCGNMRGRTLLSAATCIAWPHFTMFDFDILIRIFYLLLSYDLEITILSSRMVLKFGWFFNFKIWPNIRPNLAMIDRIL